MAFSYLAVSSRGGVGAVCADAIELPDVEPIFEHDSPPTVLPTTTRRDWNLVPNRTRMTGTVWLRNDPYHRQTRSVICTPSVRP
jgi:hypothetical protein